MLVAESNSAARCGDERSPVALLVMTPKRRALTPDELAAADEFRRLLLASDKTQEQIAQEIGVTQGAVWQWADGKVPISAKRARDVAAVVHGDPAAISVAYREAFSGRVSEPSAAYQPERLDLPKLAAAQKFLEDLFAAHGVPFVASERTHLLAAVYDELLQTSTPNLVDMATRFGRQVRGDDERQGKVGSAGENDRRRAGASG